MTRRRRRESIVFSNNAITGALNALTRAANTPDTIVSQNNESSDSYDSMPELLSLSEEETRIGGHSTNEESAEEEEEEEEAEEAEETEEENTVVAVTTEGSANHQWASFLSQTNNPRRIVTMPNRRHRRFRFGTSEMTRLSNISSSSATSDMFIFRGGEQSDPSDNNEQEMSEISDMPGAEAMTRLFARPELIPDVF